MTLPHLTKPFLVPCIIRSPSQGKFLPPETGSLPCPVTVSALRGAGTPYPARRVTLSFHSGGSIGAAVNHLSFDRAADLLCTQLPHILDDIDDKDALETCARYWDLCSPDYRQGEIWDAAQAACEVSSPTGKTPWGDYRVYLHDGFVFYLHDPDFKSTGLLAGVENLKIAWLLSRPPSAHACMLAVTRLSKWLSWLAGSNGWPGFDKPQLQAQNL